VTVSQAVVDEMKRIILESEVTKEDDHSWPEPDRVGRQELEVKMGSEHVHFTVWAASCVHLYIRYIS
jgi:protein mago nashi